MHPHRPLKTLSLALALVCSAALLPRARADYRPVVPNKLGNPAKVTERTRNIRVNRAQGHTPAYRQKLLQRLTQMKMDSSYFRRTISQAPMDVRNQVFVQKAAEQNTPASTFTRRLRGMLKENGKLRVAQPSKTFFEVTPDNFALFQKTMGQNTVWFAVNSSPGHLHTLIGDQGGKSKRFVHNVYGVKNNDAVITGNYTQYALPVQLTDQEMNRFVRYLNAGSKQGHTNVDGTPASYVSDSGTDQKKTVYGFYTKGNKITDIRCTNWVTSAPIGDRRLLQLANSGNLNKVPEIAKAGGLHAALAAAPDEGTRAKLIQQLQKVPNLTRWNRAAIARMGKAFQKELADFPNRPADLVLRRSLAETLGLGRAQDPAKWSYDLLMSKRVPTVGVLTDQRKADFHNMEFNMEIMGKLGPNGLVVSNATSYGGSYVSNADHNRGVIPAGRSPYMPLPEAPAGEGTAATTTPAGQ